MGLFSGLSHVFHSIGHLLGGGDDDKDKNKQKAPTYSAGRPTGGASGSWNNGNNQNNQQEQQEDQAPTPSLNLFQAPKKSGQDNSWNMSPLQKAVTAAKDAGGAAAGASLGVLRAGEGLVQGTADLPSAVAHGVDWLANKATGNTGNSRITKGIDAATKQVDKPLDWLATNTDNAAAGFGDVSNAVYKPAQVATNVVTLVPGAVAAGAKGAQFLSGGAKLVKTINEGGKLPEGANDVVKALTRANDFVKGQTAASPVLQTLDKVKSAAVKSINPNQAEDAAAQTAAKQAADQQDALAAAQNDARVRSQMDVERANRGTPVPLQTPAAGGVAEDTLAASRNQTLVDQQTGHVMPEPSETPAYLAKAGPAQAEDLSAATADPLEVPAFQRQGKQVEQFNAQEFNDNMTHNAGQVAANPKYAGAVSEAYRASGSQNPLSLVAQTLAKTSNKGDVRDIVSQLIPESKGASLNRTVNAVTGADDPVEVLQALHENGASMGTTGEPFGALSNAPAPEPRPTPSPDAPLQKAPATPDVSTNGTQPAAISAPSSTPVTEPVVPEARPGASAPVPQERPVAEDLSQSGATPSQGSPLNTNQIPDGNTQVPAAPRTREAVSNQLGEMAKQLPDGNGGRSAVNINDLKGDAAGLVAGVPDNELLDIFASSRLADLPSDVKGLAVVRAGLDRLAKMDAADPMVQDAVNNALDEIAARTSKSGQIQRFVQDDFDQLPIPMKARYIAKQIDKANKDVKGYVPLSQDPERASEVDAAITNYLKKSEAVADKVTALEGRANAAAEAATRGEAADIKGLRGQINEAADELAAQNGELVKYYSDLIPGRSLGNKVLSDFPRRAMLSSFTGRINDLLTTGSNVAELGANNLTQSVLAKAYNRVKGAGSVTDTSQGKGRILSGAVQGVKRVAGQISGKQYTGDLQKALQANTEGRSGLQKATGKVSRTIQAATEAATDLSRGVADQKVYQLAHQEGSQMGLKGKMLKQYAEARSAAPSPEMRAAGDELHKQINNLNDNPISRQLSAIAKSIEGKSAIGGLLKNQILPFTSWLGGNIWNSVTDKNVVATTYKFIRDASRGDAEGAIKNLARSINGTAGGLGVGYGLSKAGILTDKNAEGYSDQGAYLHVGNRYIGLGVLGFAGVNLMLGHAAYQGLNTEGNPAENIAKTLGGYAWNTMFGQALGAENNLQRSIEAGTRKGAGVLDGAATFLGNTAGQFVPALGSDVNAVLNQTKLNPTHEKADTKVTNPNSPSGQAKDVPGSVVKTLENKVPGLSQTLPRKAGVAADDPYDRVSHGDRDTSQGIQNKADQKKAADQKKDFGNRDVPYYADKNFEDKVEARVENGEYDKAIEAKQAQLDSEKNNKDIPQKKKDALADEIKGYQVLKKGNYDPKIRDLYKSTSVTEWRNMGDPNSEDYDPETYQKLFDYDSDLAKSGISGSTKDKSDNKFTAKTSKKKSGGGGGRGGSANKAESAALKLVQSNKIGSTPTLQKISFGDLVPQKITDAPIPVIANVKPGDVIKKRAISVGSQ